MNKYLLILFFLFSSSEIFAQSISQYNTGTLFDSFENPAQKAFIPDSSRRFAFNLFVPNFDGNVSLTGDAQRTLKNRLFLSSYNNKGLVTGQGDHYNYLLGNANAYALMFKMFDSFNGDVEIGGFIDTKAEVRGVFTDESIALFNGEGSFANDAYSNVLNSRYQYQIYNEIGVTYREQVSKQLALGFKLGYVVGYQSANVDINQSSLTFDDATNKHTATIALQGNNEKTWLKNTKPFENPGMTFSMGSIFRTNDGFILQANIKDLGFIHWDRFVQKYNFNNSAEVTDLTSANRENSVYDAYNKITTSGELAETTYNTPLDGRAELSVSKLIWANDDYSLKYSPTLIASKELFYTGFVGAWVNPVTYNNKYTISLTTAYTDTKLFTVGGQFMIKTPNAEFFIGSDRLMNNLNLLSASSKNQAAINSNPAFTGADITLGFSLKFGDYVEHPMNASVIPHDPDKGLIGRLWDKLFNPDAGTIRNN